MHSIRVNEMLWGSSTLPDSTLPEGLFERWRARDGQTVAAGQAVAEVRIEDALPEILAPGEGVLVCSVKAGDVVLPGDRVGWIGHPESA